MPQGQNPDAGRGGKDDLKRREYRDEKGQVHHHTRSYMGEHGGESPAPEPKSFEAGGRKASARQESAASRGDGLPPRQESSRTVIVGGSPRPAQHGARTTVDHDEIREWAEANGGKPAAVARTHSDKDVGIVRIMFPDAPNSEHAALTEISWDEFFEEFEKRALALLYDPNSLFSKIIGRDTAEKRAHGDHKAAR